MRGEGRVKGKGREEVKGGKKGRKEEGDEGKEKRRERRRTRGMGIKGDDEGKGRGRR